MQIADTRPSAETSRPHPTRAADAQRGLANAALAIFAIAFATIAGAWVFQYFGYPPCDLCYEQRYAYYAGVPVALLTVALARAGAPRALVIAALSLLALMFAYNAYLAVYHSGVEAKLWAGPTACTGAMAEPATAGDLLKQLETVKVVRCDEVNLRVFGLSLANWNILISTALAVMAARAVWMTRRG